MVKSTKMWCANDVYYKHGQASLHSFLTEDDLRFFLTKQLMYYSEYLEEVEDSDIEDFEDSDIELLIKYTVSLGQQMVEGQYGHGVIEVHMLDFCKQEITVYD